MIRRINHQKLPEVQQAEESFSNLLRDIEPLIRNLPWKDFELLIDLIFTYAGWQRVGTLGKTEKAIDLEVMSPVTGNRAFIQIKSQSTLRVREFKEYIVKYKEMDQFNEMYFVVHTPDNSFQQWQDTTDIKLFDVAKISQLVMNSGLIRWLIQKGS